MKVYEGLDPEGRLVYFEVSNAMLTRRAASKLVSHIPGVSVSSSPSLWPFGNDDAFCRFDFDGKYFELWEPFGDNSRFHIAATPLESCEGLEKLRAAFQQHRPISGAARWLILVAGVVLILFRFFRH